ncbi:hypothetical protein CXB51_006055 [Gossypium anomalum]|uniref:Uncharacterized protein n=1 Tax=Gossypium anomalum TaxID=47600 RepID=A0A8J5ZD44_9ROSI|nr:hypothetical protein CXB51_006055 [Gossypium anomalum]
MTTNESPSISTVSISKRRPTAIASAHAKASAAKGDSTPSCKDDLVSRASSLPFLTITPELDLNSFWSKAASKLIRMKGSLGGVHVDKIFLLVISFPANPSNSRR